MEIEEAHHRGKDLSEFERGFIKALLKNNFHASEVQKQLADEGFQRSESSIRNFHKKMKLGESITPKRDNCKSFGSIGEKTGEKMKQAIIDEPYLSGRELTFDDNLNPNGVSHGTINRFLSDKIGFDVIKMSTSAKFISEQNKSKRYAFALNHKEGTIKKGGEILFSDESYLFGKKQGKKLCRVLEGESKEDEKLFDSLEDEKYKILVGGCISAEGVVDLVGVHESIDQKIYEEEILENHVKDFKFLDYEGVFQQDNAPPHRANKTKQGFNKNNIKLLEGPPQSPDLSPIENVWAFLKDYLGKIKKKQGIFSKHEVWTNSQDAGFSPKCQELISKCYESLPKRMELIIEKKGDKIHY